jgi:hypothetical protein
MPSSSLPPLCADIVAKVYFAQVTKNSPGRRRDVRVKMWGTSSPDHKLTGDLGNGTEATKIGGRWLDFFTAGKLALGNLGLLQQYLPAADISHSDSIRFIGAREAKSQAANGK